MIAFPDHLGIYEFHDVTDRVRGGAARDPMGLQPPRGCAR